jgi:hypothetical protein
MQGWLCFAPQPITKKHEVLEMTDAYDLNSEYRILTAIRWRAADLLHLLQFAEISTPTPRDAEQAIRLMQEMRDILNPSEEI